MNRRGACPGFSAPMPTGDGLLARLHPAGPMPLSAFTGLCRAAESHGNGLLEVTQRGSLQVRGLKSETLPGFRTKVDTLDFDAPEGVVVQTPPLSRCGLGLAATLREALRQSGIAARIAPKVTVMLDTGDGLPIDDLSADIRLHATGDVLHVGLGEGPVVWIGTIAQEVAGEAVSALLEILSGAGPAARVRDLQPASFCAGIRHLLIEGPPLSTRLPVDAVGRHRDSIGVGLPFGSSEAAVLHALVAAAARAGADRVWAAPGRALIFETVAAGAAATFVAEAAAVGVIVDAGDPRRRVHACTGAPGCASALQPVRGLAREVARLALVPPDARSGIHLSGCAKGCAHPGRAAVTLVGWERGFHLVLNGRANGAPTASLTPTEILTKLPDLLEKRRRAPEGAVARGVGAGRG